jgi:hypothetical protein
MSGPSNAAGVTARGGSKGGGKGKPKWQLIEIAQLDVIR